MKQQDFKLTDEQKDIIEGFATGNNVIVQALAGTGKTSTLVSLGEVLSSFPKYRNKAGVYLAFNRANAIEAKGKFSDNISAQTIHAMVLRDMQGVFKGPIASSVSLKDLYSFIDFKEHKIGRKIFYKGQIAAASVDAIRFFCNSNLSEIPNYFLSQKLRYNVINYANYHGKKDKWIEDVCLKLKEITHKYAKTIWDLLLSNNLPMHFDGYLKVFQLQKRLIPGAAFILFDEAQDANDCIMDILQNQAQQIAFVGDSNQAIYGFRGAKDLMVDKIDGVTKGLTQSFRFGQPIADIANRFLKLNQSPFLLKGNPHKESFVKPVNTAEQYTYISRTNSKLFMEAITLMNERKKIFIEGFSKSMMSLILDVYNLYRGETFVSSPQLSGINDYSFFMHLLGHDALDPEVRTAYDLVDEYQSDLPKILKQIEDNNTPAHLADVILTTAHKSKGREWDQVKLNKDFRITRKGKDALEKEEINVVYVSITRAIKVLDLTSGIVEVSEAEKAPCPLCRKFKHEPKCLLKFEEYEGEPRSGE